MDKKQWKHKIGGGVGCGTILIFFMMVGMAALCLWFHKTDNSAIILGRIILTVFAVAFVLSLYRTIFFKVLIGKDGFYYQSAPGNGRYYSYSEIRKAWISSSRETNANTAIYCNYETRDGKTVRIAITEADRDAADYLVKRVAAVVTSDATSLEDDHRDYTISGKTKGLTRIAVICFIFGIVMWLSYSLAREGMPPIDYVLPAFAVSCALAYVILHYFFYKIEIKCDGFYCRTNPFNGQFYKYRDVTNCKLIEHRKRFGSAYRRGVRQTHYLHYLIFTDKSGKERSIEYDKGLFDREINILVSRIRQSQS